MEVVEAEVELEDIAEDAAVAIIAPLPTTRSPVVEVDVADESTRNNIIIVIYNLSTT